MTKDYSHAIAWIENHNNPDNYDDDEYNEFVQASRDKFSNSELFDNPDFKEQLDKLWYNYHNKEDIEEQDSGLIEESGTREINMDRTTVVNKGTITQAEAPVRVESKSPIRITPIEQRRNEPSIPVSVVVPKTVSPQQKQSIFRRFIGLFRRRR